MTHAGCLGCPAGQDVCIAVLDDLLCTTPALCADVLARGFEDACVWSDGSHWSPSDVIPTPTCPSGAASVGLCGGACGGCPSGQYCEGRSPSHPFGICLGVTEHCYEDPSCTCGSFAVADPAFQPLADKYGYCIDAGRCASLHASMPGGFRCDGS